MAEPPVITPATDVGAERTPERRRDRGTSLVEILMAIVLLGTAVGAMLTTMRVTINASALQRDHANAHAWLQSAADVLYGAPRADCGTQTVSRQTEVRNTYQGIVSGTENPENWPSSNIEVVSPVLFWDGDEYQLTCYDDDGVNLQLITIQVRNLDGRIIESVQVVKG
jgi:Tfp pilus assembly protein PilX